MVTWRTMRTLILALLVMGGILAALVIDRFNLSDEILTFATQLRAGGFSFTTTSSTPEPVAHQGTRPPIGPQFPPITIQPALANPFAAPPAPTTLCGPEPSPNLLYLGAIPTPVPCAPLNPSSQG